LGPVEVSAPRFEHAGLTVDEQKAREPSTRSFSHTHTDETMMQRESLHRENHITTQPFWSMFAQQATNKDGKRWHNHEINMAGRDSQLMGSVPKEYFDHGLTMSDFATNAKKFPRGSVRYAIDDHHQPQQNFLGHRNFEDERNMRHNPEFRGNFGHRDMPYNENQRSAGDTQGMHPEGLEPPRMQQERFGWPYEDGTRLSESPFQQGFELQSRGASRYPETYTHRVRPDSESEEFERERMERVGPHENGGTGMSLNQTIHENGEMDQTVSLPCICDAHCAVSVYV
jgi:hypothetical protein